MCGTAADRSDAVAIVADVERAKSGRLDRKLKVRNSAVLRSKK